MSSSTSQVTRQVGQDGAHVDWSGNPANPSSQLDVISQLFGVLGNIPLESSLYPKLHGMLGEEIKQLTATWKTSQYRVPDREAKAKLDNPGMAGGSTTAAAAVNPIEPEQSSRVIAAVESLAKSASSIDSHLGEIVKLLERLPSVPAEPVVRTDPQREFPAETPGGVSTNCSLGDSVQPRLPSRAHTTAPEPRAQHLQTAHDLLSGISTTALASSDVPAVSQAKPEPNASSTGHPRTSISSDSSGSDIPFAGRGKSSDSQAPGGSSAENLEDSRSAGKSGHAAEISAAAAATTAAAPIPPAVVIDVTNENQLETPVNRSAASSPPSHRRNRSNNSLSTAASSTAPPDVARPRARTATPHDPRAANTRVTASTLLSQFTRPGPAKRPQAATASHSSDDEENIQPPGPKRRRAGNKDSA